MIVLLRELNLRVYPLSEIQTEFILLTVRLNREYY